MPEYNFWDDRTTEVNDSDFCPIAQDYCSEPSCDVCQAAKEWDAYWSAKYPEEGGDP